MAAPGLVSPDNYPIRMPTDKSLVNGRIANPPRFYEIGGIASQAVWFKEGGTHAWSQSPQANIAKVEKPTSVKSASKRSREND